MPPAWPSTPPVTPPPSPPTLRSGRPRPAWSPSARPAAVSWRPPRLAWKTQKCVTAYTGDATLKALWEAAPCLNPKCKADGSCELAEPATGMDDNRCKTALATAWAAKPCLDPKCVTTGATAGACELVAPAALDPSYHKRCEDRYNTSPKQAPYIADLELCEQPICRALDGGAQDGTCTTGPKAKDTPCRAQASNCGASGDQLCPCDVADKCDGSSITCEDKKALDTHVCRAAGDACDVPGEQGAGAPAARPDLSWSHFSVRCPARISTRAPIAPPDMCDGETDACPADVRKDFGHVRGPGVRVHMNGQGAACMA